MPVAADEPTQRWLASKSPQPNHGHLEEVLARVRRVQVVLGGEVEGAPIGTEVVADTIDAEEIDALRRSLRIVDGGDGHCMCHGDVALLLFDDAGERVAVLGVHHGHAIRWNRWRDDAELTDAELLCRWLAARGVHSVLEEYLATRQVKDALAAELQTWRLAIPSCLNSFTDAMMNHERGAFDTASIEHALSDAFADPCDRALVLMEWLGHGARPWNGGKTYERIPLTILEGLSLDSLLEALRVPRLSEAQLEGAARFFSGWHFRKRGPGVVSSLLDSDRQRLLEHVERTGGPEAVHRVRNIR